MKRNKIEIYEYIYDILDKYYDKNKTIHLGLLLNETWGIMTEVGYRSKDEAVFSDYSKLWDKKIGENKKATETEGYYIFKESVIDYYKRVPQYKIEKAEEYLKGVMVDGKKPIELKNNKTQESEIIDEQGVLQDKNTNKFH